MTHDGKRFFLTPHGLARLQEERKTLKERRMARVDELKTIEIDEDEQADEELEFIDHRLQEIEAVLQSYSLIEPPLSERRHLVGLGATVHVLSAGKASALTIVGTLEADPRSGRISDESPVGQALLGRKAGDVVLVRAKPKLEYLVKRVSYGKV